MRYLAQISGTARSDDPGKIQTQIMQANPILEGNLLFFLTRQLSETQKHFVITIAADLENL